MCLVIAGLKPRDGDTAWGNVTLNVSSVLYARKGEEAICRARYCHTNDLFVTPLCQGVSAPWKYCVGGKSPDDGEAAVSCLLCG